MPALILPGLAISYRLHSRVFLQENALSPNLLMTLLKLNHQQVLLSNSVNKFTGKRHELLKAFSSIVALIPSTIVAGDIAVL